MKGQAGAVDMFLFIVLVMSSGILILYVSSIFLKSINDQIFVQRVKLMEKQIFLSIISIKKPFDPNDEFKGYSYLYLSKMCSKDNKDELTLEKFFNEYVPGLWNNISETVYNGKIVIEICGYYYPCEGTECVKGGMKSKINELKNQSHKVIVYRVSAFDPENQEEDGYDTHIYYFD